MALACGLIRTERVCVCLYMDSRARAVAAIAQGARPAAVVPAGAAAATELSRLKKQLHELEEKRDNVIKKRRSRREARPPSCWAACGRRGGACPQFCGEGGACCKLAWVSDGRDPNACPAEMAEFRYHTCVAQSFVGVNKGDPAMTDFSISSAGVHLGRTNLVREPGYTRPTMDDYYAFADGTSALPAAIERHLSDRGRAGKTPWPDAQQQESPCCAVSSPAALSTLPYPRCRTSLRQSLTSLPPHLPAGAEGAQGPVAVQPLLRGGQAG